MTPKVDSRWKHKNGGEYIIIGIGTMQSQDWVKLNTHDKFECYIDMEEVVIYSDYKTFWVRPIAEFLDGRFIEL